MSNRSLPGLCTDLNPDLFFSDNPADVAAAKAICHACPVMMSCRETANSENEFGLSGKVEFGMWGGQSAEERLGRKPMGKAVYRRNAEQTAHAAELQRLRRQAKREAQSEAVSA